jgi:hypothetical protein
VPRTRRLHGCELWVVQGWLRCAAGVGLSDDNAPGGANEGRFPLSRTLFSLMQVQLLENLGSVGDGRAACF